MTGPGRPGSLRLGLVVGATAALIAVPVGTPPWPPSAEWISRVGAADAFVAVVRTAAVAVGVHLVAATLLCRGLHALRQARLAAAVAATLPRALRPLAVGALAAVTPLSVAHAAIEPQPAALPAPEAPDPALEPSSPHDVATIVVLPTPLVVLAASAQPQLWTVAPGDHFWSIAEQVLADAGNESPSESETGRYWALLVDANRARLVIPGEPDVLWPGQELVLPPVDGQGE